MEERHDSADSSPELSSEHHQCIRSELESLRSKSSAMEEILALLQVERDEAVAQNTELSRVVAEISRENESLLRRIDNLEASTRDKEDEFRVGMEGLRIEAEIYRERIGEMEVARERSEEILAACLDSVKSAKEILIMIAEDIADEPISSSDGAKAKSSEGLELNEELNAFSRLAFEVKEKVGSYRESRKKEKKELENSVTSLTEENRDINSLLRVALLEKESVEKRLKGNAEQKSRVAILQRVGLGFGFMTAIGNSETSENKSHDSESEVEVVSLVRSMEKFNSEASTVERIMKNLRLEITQLRRSLEESRSDAERLQSLIEKQAQDIAENLMYIKELEDRDRVLTQNVEELLTTVRETEAEVERWREACELEVEAANVEIGERNKLVAILKQELDRTKASLEISNGKLELKNELASAAMAAQAAAEKSLKLADTRVGALRARIEDLSKHLEESEKRERSSLKIRHRLCWPWRALRPNYTTNNNVRSRLLPEMQALLRHNV